MAKTKIAWVDWTINPVRTKGGGWGCTKISPGCQHCYSEAINKRFGDGKPYDSSPKDFVLDLSCFDKLPKKPKTVFVQSMGDLFHSDLTMGMVQDIFYKIAKMPQHRFLILTKRPDNLFGFHDFCKRHDEYEPFGKTVALGVTVESPEYLHHISTLLKIPAAMYFASFEPLLNDFSPFQWEGYLKYPIVKCLDWVIVGCESGSKRRKCPIEWIEHIVEQCQDAGVPVFVKQIKINGKVSHDMTDWPESLRVRQMPEWR